MRISVLILFLCILIGIVLGQHTTPRCEMGDVVFRPLIVFYNGSWLPLGHAALYRNSDASGDWDPESEDIIDTDLQHSVIQATGEGTVVNWHSFDFFINIHELFYNEKLIERRY